MTGPVDQAQRALAITVRCPYCEAEAGAPCLNRASGAPLAHLSRLRRAQTASTEGGTRPMTATRVDERAVLADEPTRSPFSTKDGHAVYWHQTRTLLLEDGSTTYGCVHCEYTSGNWRSIRPHLRVHNRRAAERNGHTDKLGDLSLRDLSSRLSKLSDLETDRDRWRDRAKAAEKALNTVARALREVDPQ